jgi:hypothetical protein
MICLDFFYFGLFAVFIFEVLALMLLVEEKLLKVFLDLKFYPLHHFIVLSFRHCLLHLLFLPLLLFP